MPASQFSGGVESGGDYTVKMEDGDVIAIIDKPAARQALRNNLMKLQQSISNYKNLIAIHKESLELSRNVETAKSKFQAPANVLSHCDPIAIPLEYHCNHICNCDGNCDTHCDRNCD